MLTPVLLYTCCPNVLSYRKTDVLKGNLVADVLYSELTCNKSVLGIVTSALGKPQRFDQTGFARKYMRKNTFSNILNCVIGY